MKVIYVVLIALLITGCGPSAEQRTATAEMIQAQTLTAAPTLTPTFTSTPTQTPAPTYTPTPTPTLTFTPTPSSPKVTGNVQLEFVSPNEKAIIPQPPYEIELVLNFDGNEFIVDTFDESGNFYIYLEPGSYTIEYLRVRNQALGSDMHEIITDQPQISVLPLPCYYAGNITFTIWRLAPGTYEEQVAEANLISAVAGEPLLFGYLEGGGFIMPTFTKIADAGSCP